MLEEFYESKEKKIDHTIEEPVLGFRSDIASKSCYMYIHCTHTCSIYTLTWVATSGLGPSSSNLLANDEAVLKFLSYRKK